MERYKAGRWDDNGWNVFDTQTGKPINAWFGFVSLEAAEKRANELNTNADEGHDGTYVGR